MRFGLRWQIVLSLLLLMVVTVALVSIAMVGMTRGALEQQARTYAERLAVIAATTMSSALEPGVALNAGENRASLQRLTELLAAEPSGSSVRVVDRRVDPVASSPAASLPLERPELLRRAIQEAEVHVAMSGPGDRRHVDAYAPIRLEGSVVGAVHLRIPLREVRRLLDHSERVVVAYVLFDALLVLVLGYWLLTVIVARPLERLGVATERVARGDFSVEFRAAAAGELRELSEHFNRMVARLRANRGEIETRLDELRAANHQLELAQSEVVRSERLATVGTLAAGIAHEVGNPLTAVLGLVALLEEPGLLDDTERADTLQRITRELRRIDGIIRELLTFARASDDAAAHCDPGAPIEAAVRLCQHHDRARAADVDVKVEDGLPEIAASESQMVQVLLNLLLNAADAVQGRGSIGVQATRVPGGVAIDVVDDGPGMDAATQARIFDPFFTTKPPGRGTGLGLAIVERLVAQWSGHIEVQSEPGRGTRFRIVVPEHVGRQVG